MRQSAYWLWALANISWPLASQHALADSCKFNKDNYVDDRPNSIYYLNATHDYVSRIEKDNSHRIYIYKFENHNDSYAISAEWGTDDNPGEFLDAEAPPGTPVCQRHSNSDPTNDNNATLTLSSWGRESPKSDKAKTLQWQESRLHSRSRLYVAIDSAETIETFAQRWKARLPNLMRDGKIDWSQFNGQRQAFDDFTKTFGSPTMWSSATFYVPKQYEIAKAVLGGQKVEAGDFIPFTIYADSFLSLSDSDTVIANSVISADPKASMAALPALRDLGVSAIISTGEVRSSASIADIAAGKELSIQAPGPFTTILRGQVEIKDEIGLRYGSLSFRYFK